MEGVLALVLLFTPSMALLNLSNFALFPVLHHHLMPHLAKSQQDAYVLPPREARGYPVGGHLCVQQLSGERLCPLAPRLVRGPTIDLESRFLQDEPRSWQTVYVATGVVDHGRSKQVFVVWFQLSPLLSFNGLCIITSLGQPGASGNPSPQSDANDQDAVCW